MARRAVPVGRPAGGSALLLPGAFLELVSFRRRRLLGALVFGGLLALTDRRAVLE